MNTIFQLFLILIASYFISQLFTFIKGFIKGYFDAKNGREFNNNPNKSNKE